MLKRLPLNQIRRWRQPLGEKTRRTLEALEHRHLLTGYMQLNLVSDQSAAALIQDAHLINPWGMAVAPQSVGFWVADNGAAAATLYSGAINGTPFVQNPTVSGSQNGFPTGAVYNVTNDFLVNGPGGVSAPATVLVANQIGGQGSSGAAASGGIGGPGVTGLTIAASSLANFAYAADFQNDKIVVVNGSFQVTALAGSFTDPNLPAGYAPFNIQNIGGQLFVTYAQRQAVGEEGNSAGSPYFVPATTGGIVDVYDANGNLVKRFSSDSHLNAPWGIVQAPNTFGAFAGDILVGNFGDGRINAFKTDGTFDGQLADSSGNPISIAGLRALTFGNGTTAGDASTLFFTSEPGAVNEPPESPAVLLLDRSSPGALTAVGNAQVNVTGGEVVVDSTSASAIVGIGNGRLSASEFDVAGSPGSSVIGNAAIQGAVEGSLPAMADPLAGLAAPTPAPTSSPDHHGAVQATGQMNVTLSPGTYQGGISVSGQAAVTLLPGVYILQGGGLTITGQVRVVGDGVTIYNAAQSTSFDGINVYGRGSLQISAPKSGAYRGIAIFQSASGATPIEITDNSSVSLTGAFYAPAATVRISGNGQLSMQGDLQSATPAQLIANDMKVIGNGQFTLNTPPAAGLGSGQHGLLGALKVADNQALAGVSGAISATEGQQFSGVVGVAASGATAANMTAVIDWGDGQSSAGTVTASANGGFLVSGAHTYAAEGNETIKVTVSDGLGHSTTLNGSASVADAPLVGQAAVVRLNPGQLSVNNATVATFTDSGGAEAIANYAATIDWGDGSATSAGTISFANGTFTVVGSHNYSSSGRFPITVTINEVGGASTTVHSLAGHGSADNFEVYVTQVFEDVLLRAPDAAGLAYWVNALQQGLPRTNLSNLLTTSDEYLKNRIQKAYREFLARESDGAGLAYWLNQMRHGLTDEQLEAGFIGSAEFYAHGGGSDRSWVDEMYFDLLGRAPDGQGEAYWINALAHGAIRSQVAQGFAASVERESNAVQGDYRTFLGRSAGQSEITSWVNAFQNGMTNEAVVAGFLASEEYANASTHND